MLYAIVVSTASPLRMAPVASPTRTRRPLNSPGCCPALPWGLRARKTPPAALLDSQPLRLLGHRLKAVLVGVAAGPLHLLGVCSCGRSPEATLTTRVLLLLVVTLQGQSRACRLLRQGCCEGLSLPCRGSTTASVTSSTCEAEPDLWLCRYDGESWLFVFELLGWLLVWLPLQLLCSWLPVVRATASS